MENEFIRPSSLQRVYHCPGSWSMCQDIPDTESDAQAEGTLLHERMAFAVVSGILNTEGLDTEQAVALDYCMKCLSDVMAEIGEGAIADPEVPLVLHDGEGGVLTRGTCDCVVRSPDGSRVAIIDWKFGRNEVIDAAKNFQLAAYAGGAMEVYGVSECKAFVCQPRLCRTTSFTFEGLPSVVFAIGEVSRAAMGDTLVLRPCPEACTYCAAKGVCPAFRRAMTQLAPTDGGLSSLAPADLASLYEKGQMVKKWIDGELAAAMSAYLDEHGELDGWQWQEVQGRREVEDVAGLREAMSEVLSSSDFEKASKLSLSALQEIGVPRIQILARNGGEKITRTEAKKRFDLLASPYIVRGKPSRRIVRKEEKQ